MADVADDTLAVYLRNHHALARSALSLVARLVRNRSADLDGAAELPRLQRELREDFHALERVMQAAGVEPSWLQDALAVAGERLGRLKPNGRIVRRSPLADVVEAESLVVGSTGKEALWVALARAGVQAGVEDFDRLVARARSQRAAFARYRESAARRALTRDGATTPLARGPLPTQAEA